MELRQIGGPHGPNATLSGPFLRTTNVSASLVSDGDTEGELSSAAMQTSTTNIKTEDYLKPRLVGARFEGTRIPFDVLADLAALQDIVYEGAKARYLRANPLRKRVPRGFRHDVGLSLSAIEPGSAVPCILLTFTAVAAPLLGYFRDARSSIVNAVFAAKQHDRDALNQALPPSALKGFERLGRSLEGDEAIVIETPAGSPAGGELRIDRNVLSFMSEVATGEPANRIVRREVPVTVCGQDKEKRTFTLRMVDGLQLVVDYAKLKYQGELSEAFGGYEKGEKVLIHGQFELQSGGRRIRQVLEVDFVESLDPQDIGYRVEELSQLADGWLDGEGVAPKLEGLSWFQQTWQTCIDVDVRLPFLYPTPTGGLSAEWDGTAARASLDVDLEKKTGQWISRSESDVTVAEELNLANEDAWRRLGSLIRLLDKEGS